MLIFSGSYQNYQNEAVGGGGGCVGGGSEPVDDWNGVHSILYICICNPPKMERANFYMMLCGFRILFRKALLPEGRAVP